jgi:hypothetical protein
MLQPMDVTPVEVMAKLGELDADEIARLFTDLHVTGRVGGSTSCPVAAYVTQETGVRVHVLGKAWRTMGCLDVNQPCPPSVKLFVQMFDNGCYPDLVRETPAYLAAILHI